MEGMVKGIGVKSLGVVGLKGASASERFVAVLAKLIAIEVVLASPVASWLISWRVAAGCLVSISIIKSSPAAEADSLACGTVMNTEDCPVAALQVLQALITFLPLDLLFDCWLLAPGGALNAGGSAIGSGSPGGAGDISFLLTISRGRCRSATFFTAAIPQCPKAAGR